MYSRSVLVLVAALGIFAFAAPAVSRAESQSEWLHRQLQTTDGYAPPPALPAQDGDRAAASTVRRVASRAPHPGKSAPRTRRVSQQRATAPETPVCRETYAVSEPSPAQAECPECRVIESTREVDLHGEGIGLAALGALLFFAGFKVMKTVGAVQPG